MVERDAVVRMLSIDEAMHPPTRTPVGNASSQLPPACMCRDMLLARDHHEIFALDSIHGGGEEQYFEK
jgi:hypothetical protein